MITARPTPHRVLAVLVLAALWAQPLLAQIELLDVKADEGGSGRQGAGAVTAGAAAAAVPGGTIDPTLPSVKYEWSRTTQIVAQPRQFRLYEDTPSFANFASIGPGQSRWSEGNCFGVNLLIVTWLKMVVLPLVETDPLASILGARTVRLNRVDLPNDFTIPGPVTVDNLGWYRMRHYSAVQPLQTAGAAVKLQDDQSYPFNRGTSIGPADLLATARTDIQDPQRELTMVGIYGRTWGHSIILHGIERGYARPVGGGLEVDAFRFLIFDPNFCDATGAQDRYLMYLVQAGKYAFPPRYAAMYAPLSSTGTAAQDPLQAGTFYENTLVLEEVHGWLASTSRDVLNWAQSAVDQRTTVNLALPASNPPAQAVSSLPR